MRFVALLLIALVPVGVLSAPYAPKPLEALLGHDGAYDPSIPKPTDFLGHEVGARIAHPDLIAAYVRAVTAASDRVSATVAAESYEGRPVQAVTISSPANIARLDDLRRERRALADPEANADPAAHPVVVQATFGVHGNEPSSFEAALLAIYHFAAAQDQATTALLDDAVLLFYVQLNPDGAARYASWIAQHVSAEAVADPRHREHVRMWPAGRTNHYWFDLNRQWLPLAQPEIRGVVTHSLTWAPNVAADLHEMGADQSYFFSPGPLDRVHPMLPDESQTLTLALGEALASALDRSGRLHVSAEFFDDFYLGYGSSYPGLHGAIPFLFEQSSARGRLIDTRHGRKRYDDKIAGQFATLRALIEDAAARRVELNDYLKRFHRRELGAPPETDARGWVFGSEDVVRLADFVQLMLDHRIEVRAVARETSIDDRTFAPDSAYFVPADQTLHRLARGIFDRQIVTDEEEFYDVSGWTLPDAFGLDWRRVTRRAFSPSLAGDRVESPPAAAATPPSADAFAWVIDPRSEAASALYADLLAEGVRLHALPAPATLRTANGPFEAPRGSVVVQAQHQSLDPGAIAAILSDAASRGVTAAAATGSRTDAGLDLGTFDLAESKLPKVVMVVGDGVSPYSSGSLWHLVDRRVGLPVAMIEIDDLSDVALDGFTHLVLPHGRYGSASEDAAGAVERWMRRGGVVLAVRGGSDWLIQSELVDIALAEAPATETPEEPTARRPYDNRRSDSAARDISGAIFAVDVDLTHPLNWGRTLERASVHKIGRRAFKTGDSYNQPVAYGAESPLLSGYAGDDAQELTAGAAAVAAERRGEGAAILFADDPYFRAYWRGSARVFVNGLFHGTAFRNGPSP